jgi:hypothetical protein
MYIYLYIYIYIGGHSPDKSGKGLKPFMVNEMTMLAHYHHKMGIYKCIYVYAYLEECMFICIYLSMCL